MLKNDCSTKEIHDVISKLKPEDAKADIFGYKTKSSEFRFDLVNDRNIWTIYLTFEKKE